MFNGFSSTTTPSYQFWDCTKTPSPLNAARRIALTDDCAPFQFIVGGGSSGPIYVDLPVNPVAGKTITIKVERATGSYIPSVYVREPATAGNSVTTSYSLATMSASQQCTFVYIPEANTISGGTSPTSGWVSGGSFTFGNNRESGAFLGHGSAILAGAENKAGSYFSTICGGRGTSFNSGAYYSTVVGGKQHSINNSYAFIGGGTSNGVSGSTGTIAGGDANNANGTASSITGGANNTASGDYSTISGGSTNDASGEGAAISGGIRNTASGVKTFIGSGGDNVASGFYSAILAGSDNLATGEYSSVVGGTSTKARNVAGIVASSASNNPVGFGAGICQTELLVVGRTTTDSTPIVATSNDVSNGALATNQLFLPTDSAYYVRGSAVAFCQTTGDAKEWTFTCLIKNVAGTVSIVGSPTVTSTFADTGASSWALAIAADNTNKTLGVTVTGDATNSVRIVCRLDSTEASWS